jgi:hypothetical protein
MANPFLRALLTTRSGYVTRSAASYVSSRHACTAVLLGVSALSNRHETQYLSRLPHLPLMEHSPTLRLIHTSEVLAAATNTQPDSSVVTYLVWKLLSFVDRRNAPVSDAKQVERLVESGTTSDTRQRYTSSWRSVLWKKESLDDEPEYPSDER